MRVLVLLALVAFPACHVGLARAVEPVVLDASLEGGTVEAGAVQGIGATLVNRSRSRVVHYGHPVVSIVRLFRETTGDPRRADAPSDTTRPVGPYWERAYHLAYAPEPGETTTLVGHVQRIEAGGRLVLTPVRFEWPRDPGAYWVSVCSGYAPSDRDEGREVCARASASRSDKASSGIPLLAAGGAAA